MIPALRLTFGSEGRLTAAQIAVGWDGTDRSGRLRVLRVPGWMLTTLGERVILQRGGRKEGLSGNCLAEDRHSLSLTRRQKK